MTKLREEDVMCAERCVEEGSSIRSMALMLRVDESTLRYRLKRLRDGTRDGRRRQPEACVEYEAEIVAWIERQNERRPRPLPVKSLYDDLVSEHGFTGSYKSVLRFVNRRRPRPKRRPHRRVEVQPGSQVQIDWFERMVRLGPSGTRTRLVGLIVVLSFSRMWSVVWCRSQDLLSWISGHRQAFVRLGGIAWTWRIDNLKTGVSKGGGPWATIHPGYESYCSQMGGLLVDPTRIRTPRDKGKVERRVRDMDALLRLNEEIYADLESLRAATDTRIRKRARELRHPLIEGSYLDAWAMERSQLLPLPSTLPTPFDVQVARPVRGDGLVSFEGRQYQVPFQWIDRQVEVRGGPGVVEIFGDRRLLVSYPRGTSCRRLQRQDFYEGNATDTIAAPTPLGRVGRQIVLERTWEIPRRSIDEYAAVLEELGR